MHVQGAHTVNVCVYVRGHVPGGNQVRQKQDTYLPSAVSTEMWQRTGRRGAASLLTSPSILVPPEETGHAASCLLRVVLSGNCWRWKSAFCRQKYCVLISVSTDPAIDVLIYNAYCIHRCVKVAVNKSIPKNL